MEVYCRDGDDWQDYLQLKAIAEDVPTVIQQIKQEMESATNSQITVIDEKADEDASDLISEGIAGIERYRGNRIGFRYSDGKNAMEVADATRRLE